MRRDTALRLRVPQSRTSMYAPVGILAAPCLARILLCFTLGIGLRKILLGYSVAAPCVSVTYVYVRSCRHTHRSLPCLYLALFYPRERAT